MTKLKMVSVVPGATCYINDGGGDQGRLRMLGITGRTMFIADHTTIVTIYMYLPATSTTPAGPIRVTYNPSGVFLPVAPFIVDTPCRPNVTERIDGTLKVVHTFRSNSTAAEQVLNETVPFVVDCPLSACRNLTRDSQKKSLSKSPSKKSTKAAARSKPATAEKGVKRR